MIEHYGLNKRIWIPNSEELQKEWEWAAGKIEEIGSKNLLRLARKARNVRKNAYQPYSDYSVGAAILTTDKKVFASCNGEVVNFTGTDHAETGAISKAISAGIVQKVGRRFIEAIAISHGGHSSSCGACRQRIIEHSDNCLVIEAGTDGEIIRIATLQTILPLSFNPSHLGK